MYLATGDETRLFPLRPPQASALLALVIDQESDADPQVLRDTLATTPGHQMPELGFELEGPDTGRTIVDVLLDLLSDVRSQFTVEEVVDTVKRLSAVILHVAALDVIHPGHPRAPD
jgi:hypothetical protein